MESPEQADRERVERALRRSVLAGDEDAWRVLFERGFEPLRSYVRCRVSDPHHVDEVVSEVWMVAVRAIRRFDPERAPFEVWLFGIARNVLRNHVRASTRRAAPATLTADPVSEPNEYAAAVGERITRALTSLSVRYQQVLRARYREDRSVSSIARASGESEKAIESTLTRARRAFREAFARLEREEQES